MASVLDRADNGTLHPQFHYAPLPPSPSSPSPHFPIHPGTTNVISMSLLKPAGLYMTGILGTLGHRSLLKKKSSYPLNIYIFSFSRLQCSVNISVGQ